MAHTSKSAWKKAGYIALLCTKWFVIAGIAAGFLAFGTGVGYVAALVKDDEVRSASFITKQMGANAMTSFAYFNDDSEIGQLRSQEDRRMAELKDIPKIMTNAVVAIEDNQFYNHYGVDFNGLVRAVKQKMLHEDVQTGGSTITQQLARRVFLSLDKEDSRKAKELFLSLRLERILSKDEILLAYLNKIPYGNGSSGYNLFGIKAAAKGIFNIDNLNDLNIAQAAYLAGLPQLPSAYSAFTSRGSFDEAGFNKAVARQQLVLKRMLEEGKITEQQHQEALKFDLKGSLAQPQKKAYATYPFLMLEVERAAAAALVKQLHPEINPQTQAAVYNEAVKAARAQLLRGGYQIYTTIDKTIYDKMQEIARNDNNFTKTDPNDPKKIEQIGAIMIQNRTGAILGMIEGRDFNAEQSNHATQTLRQPGSTMKPLAAYLPALETGAIQPASVIDDVPILLKDGTKNSGGFHIPRNWDTDFHGLVSARTALQWSYNIPAIKLFLNTVGIDKAWEFVKKLGITTIAKEDYSAQTGVIGGLKYGVSVEELTDAYSAIGNKGMFNDAFFIRKIVDSEGKILYEHKNSPTPVFSAETAYLMTDMLNSVVESGTAADLKSKFKHYGKVPFVGKTGSTQDDADAWFMGYSPDITVGVWAGYDQPVNKLSKATGGTNRAKDIWLKVMDQTIDSKPELFPAQQFDRPDKIVEMTVSKLSGMLPNELTSQSGKLVTDLFNSDFAPKEADNVMVRMKVISYEGRNYVPRPGTPSEFLTEKIVVKREKSINQVISEVSSALLKLPEDKRQPIVNYYPLDSQLDAPSETDPRIDDGKEPEAASMVALTQGSGSNVLTFQGSPSSDVVGHRIYRSINKGPFAVIRSIPAGAQTRMEEQAAAGALYGYFVAAVDVAGKESARSKEVYSDGSRPPADSQAKENGSAEAGDHKKPGSIDPALIPAERHPGNVDKLPAAPAGLTVKQKDAGILVSWKANTAADKVKQYYIYYSDNSNGPYSLLASTPDTEFYHLALIRTGYYQVSAVNEAGESKKTPSFRYTSRR